MTAPTLGTIRVRLSADSIAVLAREFRTAECSTDVAALAKLVAALADEVAALKADEARWLQ